MNKIKFQSVVILLIFTVSAYSVGTYAKTYNTFTIPGEYKLSTQIQSAGIDDFDPLCDVEVTFKLKTIRSLERTEHQLHLEKKIDAVGKPDFYAIVTINDVEFTSPVWKNTQYLYDLNWTATVDVPDDNELVTIRIQLWDWDVGRDKRCDISSFYDDKLILNYDAEISYSIAAGHWFGDDFVNAGTWLSDPSGYGRLNGCDDRSYYDKERDCELWFDVYQTDPDGDGIPYWTEVNVFETDPEVDNTGEDDDSDGCPIEWEHKWGHQMSVDDDSNTTEHWWIYDPIEPDAHKTLDPDRDGLDNVEEYLTSQWGSDPFRKDLFIEFDEMEEGPDGLMVQFPEDSKELLATAYNSRNIVLHLDDGSLGGGESIPFTEETLNRNDLKQYYFQYFLHGNLDNWRVGVFHYALHLYDAGWAGYVFGNGYTDHLDSLQISSKYHEEYTLGNPLYNLLRRKTFNIQTQRERVYAAVLMHETGHTLGIFNGNTPGCDNSKTLNPLQYDFWKYGVYKSVMNYRYVYSGLIDYSDGSRGKNDFNDWDTLDLTFFQS
jgi:hypothetical protein